MLFILSRVAGLAASKVIPTVRSIGSGSWNSIPPSSCRFNGNGFPFRRNLISMNSFMINPCRLSAEEAERAIVVRNSVTVSHLISALKGSSMPSDATLAMQRQIVANQKKILANQLRIQRNQAKLDKIVANQKKLDQILANQKTILARLR
jgi:hypothetical protein